MSTVICSRCKVKREVGVTDPTDSDLSNFKTCLSCRSKLKEYRKTHIQKRQKLEIDRENQTDDQINVVIIPKAADEYIKKGKLRKKYMDFNRLLNKIYTLGKLNDVDIDEIVQIDKFTIPPILIGTESGSVEKDVVETEDPDGTEEEEEEEEETEIIDEEEEIFKNINESSKYLLANQAEKDEKLKNELNESFEIHYINRIKHILKLCELEFRFYVSSWKGGKYYTSFRCCEDKNALKRFGIDVNKIDLEESPRNEQTPIASAPTTLLKSKLLDWVEPSDDIDEPVVEENLKIENESVSNVFHSSFGYFCQSKLNFIVDYSKLEFRFKFFHIHHNLDLKYEAVDFTPVPLRPLRTAHSIPVPVAEVTKENEDDKDEQKNLSAKLNKLHETLEL